MAEGAVGVIAGLVALFWPGMTASGLLYVIAGWAVATGILKIVTTIVLRGEVENGWLLAGSGALSVLFVAPFIGVFAIVVGLALIVFAFRTRDRQRSRQG